MATNGDCVLVGGCTSVAHRDNSRQCVGGGHSVANIRACQLEYRMTLLNDDRSGYEDPPATTTHVAEEVFVAEKLWPNFNG